MLNVFKQFLNQEFGKVKYTQYVASVKDSLADKSYYARKKGSEELYMELYRELQNEDATALAKRMEKLIDTMCTAVRIHRQYLFVVIFYIGSSLFLIGRQLNTMVTVASLLLISGCFLYKTWEFVVNKYCYVDANIILVYKSVLDNMIAKKK